MKHTVFWVDGTNDLNDMFVFTAMVTGASSIDVEKIVKEDNSLKITLEKQVVELKECPNCLGITVGRFQTKRCPVCGWIHQRMN